MNVTKRFTTASITITLNNSEGLENTLSSLIHSNLDQIIIVDGGSNDSSLEVIQNVSKKDKRITYVSEKDKGLYDAMNKGVLLSKCDYLIFINSGDYLFQKDFNLFQKAYNNNAMLIFGRSADCSSYKAFKKGDFFLKPYKPLWLLKFHMITHHQSVIFKKTKNLKYDINYKIGGDFKLIIEIYSKEKEIFFKNVLISVNEYAGISSNYKLGLDEHLSILKSVYNYTAFSLFLIKLYLLSRIYLFKTYRALRG
jgi:glycosyltransferase involved in cell wall biosynthesis